MIRRPPRSTRTDTLFPTRRASDLDRIGAGNREFRRGDRRVEPATDHPGDGHRDDRTAHHEGERRVPGTAGQIEEGADARGIGHAGYGKARAEQRAGEQGDDPAHHHDTPSARIAGTVTNRSEEHTSELQSLMRISYAVFCLKKKKKNSKTTSNT